jgi:rhodanese-related sulfurtransferase
MLRRLWTTVPLFTVLLSLSNGQEVIQPTEFYEGAILGLYDAIIDVRTFDEFSEGHIENATLIESLASATAFPLEILGCEGECDIIVVYCQSGNRAGVAIDLMLASGFQGTLYNGLGVSQWQEAGYPLVMTDSILLKCSEMSQNAVVCDKGVDEGVTEAPAIEATTAPSVVDQGATEAPAVATTAPTGVPVTQAPVDAATTAPTVVPSVEPVSIAPTVAPSSVTVETESLSILPSDAPEPSKEEITTKQPTIAPLQKGTEFESPSFAPVEALTSGSSHFGRPILLWLTAAFFVFAA